MSPSPSLWPQVMSLILYRSFLGNYNCPQEGKDNAQSIALHTLKLLFLFLNLFYVITCPCEILNCGHI